MSGPWLVPPPQFYGPPAPGYYYYPSPPSPGGHHHSHSWQGYPIQAPPSAPMATVALPTVFPPAAAPPPPRARRHSFDAFYLQPSPPWPYHTRSVPEYYPGTYSPVYYPRPLPPPMLHTLLNGDAIGQHLQSDLSSYHLALSRLDRGRLYPLTSTELNAPATSPPITRLRILCDLIPQWPIELSVSGMTLTPSRRERPAMGCITIADVLYTVHKCLQTGITHDEWGRLSETQETDVARAYTRRYKAYAAMESQVKREGVKRVDYLLKKIYFQGLTWLQPEAGVERVKLLVGTSST